MEIEYESEENRITIENIQRNDFRPCKPSKNDPLNHQRFLEATVSLAMRGKVP
ncbi:hypothetical protein A2U01_0087805, partial [Trifolium medium]|nr:hypothetical protein [Trifolium medium]